MAHLSIPNFDDDLMRELKAGAALAGKTMKEYVPDLLRAALVTTTPAKKSPSKVHSVTSG